MVEHSPDRRAFFKASAAVAVGACGLTLAPESAWSAESDINIIGPQAGYSPQIGTLVSMLTWMRSKVLGSVKGLTQADLDFLIDSKANTVGALLMHLAATETYYAAHTFDGIGWNAFPAPLKEKWATPMKLGEEARKSPALKGNNLDYYLRVLNETREKTLAELHKRDDKWLMTVDKSWPWGPTNTYCKWFHVCEHESNHNGQIVFLKSRLPGAASPND